MSPISLLMSAVIRPIARDVPGVPLRRTRRSVSLKSGVNDRPRNGIVARPTTKMMPTRTNAVAFEPTTRDNPRS